MNMNMGYSWVEEHYCCKPELCSVSPGTVSPGTVYTQGKGVALVTWWVLSSVFCSLERSHPSPVCTQWARGVPAVETRGEWWHWGGTAGLAVLVWPRLQDLAGGISAGKISGCAVQLLGETAALLFRKIIFHLISLFLASKRFLQTLSF